MPDAVTGNTIPNAEYSGPPPVDFIETPAGLVSVDIAEEGNPTMLAYSKELRDIEVYGIAFPKAMLPLGAISGTWTADVLLDLDGEEQDVSYVRVWLYGPTGPGDPENSDA